MSGEQTSRFVAESGHRQPLLDALDAILDRYDARRAELAKAAPAEVVTVEEREQFGLDYSAWREHQLRAALEEVAWYLEKRGHHAWLEDVGADQVPAALESVREKTAVPRPLVLRVAPAGELDDPGVAAQLRFRPDSEARIVQIEAVYGDPARLKAVPVAVPLGLDELTDVFVVETATEFVREVLFGNDRYRGFGGPSSRPTPGADRVSYEPDADVPADVGREWADSGITKRWVEQQRRSRGI